MTKKVSEQIRQRIDQSTTPLVISHERPDGDAIGSILAMGQALSRMGKQPRMAMVDGLPGRFQFLPGAAQITIQLPQAYDLLIVLDCSDLERTGFTLNGPAHINIDHHPTNELFAEINVVEPQAAATTELLYELFLDLGIALDEEICIPLMLGLVTDTIGFRTPSVRPQLLTIAADLLTRGANLAELYDRALNQRSFTGARYWGYGLQRLEREGQMMWTSLTMEDRKAVGYPGSDDADLVNLLTTIESPDIVLIFVEHAEDKIKISWRSKPGFDVAAVAASFGGGGHKQAAGAMVDGTLEQVREKVLLATRMTLNSPSQEEE